MKVVSPEQMARIEAAAYSEGSSESEFMEEAGSGVALIVHEYAETHNSGRQIILICGKGNNAGDAYVAGTSLLQLDYEVFAYQLEPFSRCSDLCQSNYLRFQEEGGKVVEITTAAELFLPSQGIIIDGIFGTGFRGHIQEPYTSIIAALNASNLPIIAIDIPSGLNGASGDVSEGAIIANETAFLGLPKMGFFLKDGWNHVGKLRYVDFGLPKIYAEELETNLLMLSSGDLKAWLPKISRSRHKYEAGYVVGLAGSPEMPGAAILAASGALHGGAGIVRLLHPPGMEASLCSSPPELIRTEFHPDHLDEILTFMNQASATFIGPGIGRSSKMLELLEKLLPRLTQPCVLDADALSLLAGKKISLPKKTVLTPHRGEMNRLLGRSDRPLMSLEYLEACRRFAIERGVTIALKGGPSFILHADETIQVNPRGDPGMATAGSGDILTGLIAALLAQGALPQDAAALGVYIHAIAGEFAASELTPYCMTATDILYRFPEGFLFYEF